MRRNVRKLNLALKMLIKMEVQGENEVEKCKERRREGKIKARP